MHLFEQRWEIYNAKVKTKNKRMNKKIWTLRDSNKLPFAIYSNQNFKSTKFRENVQKRLIHKSLCSPEKNGKRKDKTFFKTLQILTKIRKYKFPKILRSLSIFKCVQILIKTKSTSGFQSFSERKLLKKKGDNFMSPLGRRM